MATRSEIECTLLHSHAGLHLSPAPSLPPPLCCMQGMFAQLRPYLQQADDVGMPLCLAGHSLGKNRLETTQR